MTYRPILLAVLALAVLASEASAQTSHPIYDSNGKRVGSATTDSGGRVTLYDANGRVTARVATDSQGTTTIYDPHGKIINREPRSGNAR